MGRSAGQSSTQPRLSTLDAVGLLVSCFGSTVKGRTSKPTPSFPSLVSRWGPRGGVQGPEDVEKSKRRAGVYLESREWGAEERPTRRSRTRWETVVLSAGWTPTGRVGQRTQDATRVSVGRQRRRGTGSGVRLGVRPGRGWGFQGRVRRQPGVGRPGPPRIEDQGL